MRFCFLPGILVLQSILQYSVAPRRVRVVLMCGNGSDRYQKLDLECCHKYTQSKIGPSRTSFGDCGYFFKEASLESRRDKIGHCRTLPQYVYSTWYARYTMGDFLWHKKKAVLLRESIRIHLAPAPITIFGQNCAMPDPFEATRRPNYNFSSSWQCINLFLKQPAATMWIFPQHCARPDSC